MPTSLFIPTITTMLITTTRPEIQLLLLLTGETKPTPSPTMEIKNPLQKDIGSLLVSMELNSTSLIKKLLPIQAIHTALNMTRLKMHSMPTQTQPGFESS
jgi:hypothetical protein